MAKLLTLESSTRSFGHVISQAITKGARIVKDLTHTSPYEFSGSFFTFNYEPMTEQIFHDKYPLVMFSYYDPVRGMLHGYNFHHLPIHKRLYLMLSMFTVLQKLDKRIMQSTKTTQKPHESYEAAKAFRQVISFGEMQQYYKACTRQYKIKNIRSEIYVVDSSNSMLLQDMMVVPYERFENGTRREMLERSKKIYMKEIRR